MHLQINARVWAEGKWRGLHSVGVVDMIEAINGIGHAAVATDPEFRRVLAAHGLTLDATTGEVARLAPFVGAFSVPGLVRFIATSTGTRLSGDATIPAPSPARNCGRCGIGGRGLTPGRTRWLLRVAESWWRGGTPSCVTSATATQPVPSIRLRWSRCKQVRSTATGQPTG